MGHLSRLNVRHKALPCGTVKVAAGPPIVCVVDDIGVATLCCIAFEITFLVQNGVRVAREVIVTGQALIERSDFFLPSVCLPYQALLSDGRLICGSSIIPHSDWFASPSLRISRKILSSMVSLAVSLR